VNGHFAQAWDRSGALSTDWASAQGEYPAELMKMIFEIYFPSFSGKRKSFTQASHIMRAPASAGGRLTESNVMRLRRLFLWPVVMMASSLGGAPPSIDYQPKDQTVILYQPAAFGVIASGTPPLSYQWRKDGVPIAGATNDQIVFNKPQFDDTGTYSVVVSNAENSVISSNAVLTVNPPRGGDLDYSFAWGGSLDGTVRCIIAQPDGRVIIAGDFLAVKGAARGWIARLNTDGTTDNVFMNGLPGVSRFYSGSRGIYSVVLQSDGRIVVGGNFTAVNGVGRTNIARLNADGTLDPSFQDGLSAIYGEEYMDGIVYSLAVQSDGKVLVGGEFRDAIGVSHNGITRLNADGSLDSTFLNGLSGTDGTVRTITVQGDGKVLLGGNFRMVNGAGRSGIARLNTDGTLDSEFLNGLSGVNGYVLSLAVQSDGRVIIAGDFTIVNSVNRPGMARLSADGTLDNDFQPVVSGTTFAVQSDGKVLVGGRFTTTSTGSNGNYVARLYPDGTIDSDFQSALLETEVGVVSLALQGDGKVLVSGLFNTAVGLASSRIARLNANGTLDSDFENGNWGASYHINSIAVQNNGKVVIGGYFDTVNGTGRRGIARLTTDGSLDPGFQSVLFEGGYDVHAVAVQGDGKVLIGGWFSAIDGLSRKCIARLNPDGTLDTSFLNGLSGASDSVNSIAVQNDGKVLIAGAFTTVNGVNRAQIARLNINGTLDNGFQDGVAGARGYIYSVALQNDGKVLLGGYGINRNYSYCARLNTDGTLDTTFRANVGGEVSSVTVQSDQKILIGGTFSSIEGEIRYGIARLNPNGTLDTSFQSGLDVIDSFSVYSIAVEGNGRIFIGGSFSTIEGVRHQRIARLNSNGTLDGRFGNELLGAYHPDWPYGSVRSVALQGDGNVLIGGYFTTVNGVPAANIARLWGSDFPPPINNITQEGGGANLIWYAVSNRTYRVQYKADLSSTDWTDLAGDIPATGGTASKTDTTLGNATQRFYRVLLLP